MRENAEDGRPVPPETVLKIVLMFYSKPGESQAPQTDPKFEEISAMFQRVNNTLRTSAPILETLEKKVNLLTKRYDERLRDEKEFRKLQKKFKRQVVVKDLKQEVDEVYKEKYGKKKDVMASKKEKKKKQDIEDAQEFLRKYEIPQVGRLRLDYEEPVMQTVNVLQELESHGIENTDVTIKRMIHNAIEEQDFNCLDRIANKRE